MRARVLRATAVCACIAAVWILVIRRTATKPSHRKDPSSPVVGFGGDRGQPVSLSRIWQARAADFPGLAEHVTFTRGHPNPIIERVRVDKLEVCAGEENFAHPDIHTVDDTDADLRISLAGAGFLGVGATGRKLPFRLLMPMDPSTLPVVIVEGPNGTHAEQRLPYVKVKDCTAAAPLLIDVKQVPDHGPDVFAVQVTGAPQGSALLWDLGDGARVTTSEPRVEHDFHGRQQRGRFSDFLVTVQSRDPAGDTHSGSRTIELFNRAYWAGRSHRD
jgi:hypothetical protein